MLIRLVDNHWIYLDQITTNEENAIYKAFSVANPAARYMPSFGNYDTTVRKYDKRRQRVARALLHELIKVCRSKSLQFTITDERPRARYRPDIDVITPDMLSGITLDDYQVDGIKSICKSEVGLISCPTGSGKTEIAAGICKAVGCPTVILGDMKIIVDQIKKRLELRDIAPDIGAFYAGQRPSGQKIIVGSIQSLSVPSKPRQTENDTKETYARKMRAHRTRRRNAHALHNYIRMCDMLIVDEADKATSKQWRKLFNEVFAGRRKYGLSGTCRPDDPIKEINLKENLGSIIYETDRVAVQDRGRTIPISYNSILFGNMSKKYERSALDIAEKEHIIDNIELHTLVAKISELEISKDNKVGILILIEKKDLGRALQQIIPDSIFISGDDSMGRRRHAIDQFEKREINVIIGSRIIERGLDLSGGCEVLIIATGGKSSSKLSQQIGRAVRHNRLGRAKIYDFFFVSNFYLYNHSRNRLKGVCAMGYDAKVTSKYGSIEAEQLIKRRFRFPKTWR